MAAHDNLHPLQFHYGTLDLGESKPVHMVQARTSTGRVAGEMRWNAKSIHGIGVKSDMQRQGVATAIWNEGHRLAAENQGIPQPKHSADRTTEGDAWARSVGGRLPRRRQAA